MTRVVLGVLLAASFAGALPAQQRTAETLRQAHSFYERLEVERAMALLRQVVSPAWTDDVTPEQRVDAYTYLGALLVLRGQTDSAAAYFQAALEQDAFTDLDPALFTPAQIAAFARARRRTFSVATRPVRAARLDPQRGPFAIPVAVAATHSADVTVEVQPVRAPESARAEVLRGTIDGVRALTWDALLDDGHLIPPGRYALVVVGRSRVDDRADTARAYFDVAHEVEALEDTLPPLGAADLLPERAPGSVATRDLVLGLAVAAAVTAISDGVGHRELRDGGRTGARVIAALAVGTGGVSFALHRRRRDLPENVAANAGRRAERTTANDAIRRRNEEKLARTILVLTPAPGIGP